MCGLKIEFGLHHAIDVTDDSESPKIRERFLACGEYRASDQIDREINALATSRRAYLAAKVAAVRADGYVQPKRA